MKFAQIENGSIVKYPVLDYEIRVMHPNTSFPVNLAGHLPDGFVAVEPANRLTDSALQRAVEGAPTFDGEKWLENWSYVDKYTAQELADMETERVALLWTHLRSERDIALRDSDWIVSRHNEQVALGNATTLTQAQYLAWLTYRQDLRNCPAGVSDIETAKIPTPPGTLGVS